jgi:DNA-binding Lrp family transcriptional regulator
VELVNDARATLAAFSERVGGWEDVEEVQYVAGAADIVLVLQTTAMARFSHFAEAHLNDNPHVRRYQTLTVLRSLL